MSATRGGVNCRLAITLAAFLALASLTVAAEPIAVLPRQAGHCSVLLPAGWTVTANPQGSALDAYAPDGRAAASWGVLGVNMAMRAYYGPLYGPPEESILTLAGAVGQKIGVAGLRYASPEQSGGYFAFRRLEGQGGRGWVLYRVYPNGPGQYVESVYVALSQSAAGPGALERATGVALSVRCRTHLVAAEQESVTARTDKRGGKQRCEKRSPLSGYNAQLGLQEKHDSLGRNYWISNGTPETNGADGKGHYASVAGNRERLLEGRSDDC